jgi:hypothetical protein
MTVFHQGQNANKTAARRHSPFLPLETMYLPDMGKEL